jgi:hypothetical protein
MGSSYLRPGASNSQLICIIIPRPATAAAPRTGKRQPSWNSAEIPVEPGINREIFDPICCRLQQNMADINLLTDIDREICGAKTEKPFCTTRN